MSQIYSGKHLAHYAQVTLFDPDSENSIPEWGDNLNFASGSSGLCIATSNNSEIELSIYDSEADILSGFAKVGEHDVAVGNSGFRVGDVTTNSLADVAYKTGNCRIQIYTNNSDSAQVTSVALVVS
jgi:hypothetical protein